MSDYVSLTIEQCTIINNIKSKYGFSIYTNSIKVTDNKTGVETIESIDLVLNFFLMKKSAKICLGLDSFIKETVLKLIDRCKFSPFCIEIESCSDFTIIAVSYDDIVTIPLLLKQKYNIADLILELNPGESNHPDLEFRDLINGWLKYRTPDLIITEKSK